MTQLEAVQIGRELLYYSMLLAMPALAVSLIVGLVISVFQAATSIQEQTLTFVPRILAVGVLFLFTMPWMLRLSIYLTAQMLATAAEIGR
jgi:flagellar biosynthetic protein FliQ